MSTFSRPGKSQYTENEVANELGLTVEDLRLLIRDRLYTDADDIGQAAMSAFQRSDVLLLKLLTSQHKD